jgi:hypothetical protein
MRRAWFRVPVVLVAGMLAVGCNYTFRAGSGLPAHVRTLAVAPLENESDRFDVAQQIYDAIQQDIPRAFGVSVAAEENADAVIRGVVRRYTVDAGSYRSAPNGGAEVLERAVSITLEIQVIDQRERMILWENRSLSTRGVFIEGQELEEQGRELAIEQIVRDIVNGLQSNW